MPTPKPEQIQTLHPTEGKSGKKIALAKYEVIRAAILKILKKKTVTHLELMEAIHTAVSPKFEGNAQWYGETVKLDLEARQLIERTADKPQKYKLVK